MLSNISRKLLYLFLFGVLGFWGAAALGADLPKWCSNFATVNGEEVSHGRNADPDADTPDPTPLTPPEPDAVDNSAGMYGEADGSDNPYTANTIYRYKKYGQPEMSTISANLDPAGVAGQTAMFFPNEHRLGICTELPTGVIPGLPYDLSNKVTVEGYFRSGFAEPISYSTIVPSRLYTDFRGIRATRLGVGLAPYYPPAVPGLTDADSFDYTGLDIRQDGGIGFDGAWFRPTGSSSPYEILSNDGVSLSYPCTFEPPLAPLTPGGSRILCNWANINRMLSHVTDMSLEGQTLYVSVLIRKPGTSYGGSEAILIQFEDAAGNVRFGCGINSTEKFWLNGAAQAATTVEAADPQETYLLVARLVTHATTPDVANLKIFGLGWAGEVPATEPAEWDLEAAHPNGSNAMLDRIRITSNPNNISAQIDELRIGTTWQSVVDANAPLAHLDDEPYNVMGVTWVAPDPLPENPNHIKTLVAYGQTRIDADDWHHFAMVHDGTDPSVENRSIKVYLDGNLEIEVPAADVVLPGAGHLGFGNDDFEGNDGRNWFGGLDELRVYDAVLTPGEFLMSGTPRTANLIWQSSFEEQDGSPVAHDDTPVLGVGLDLGVDDQFSLYPREFFKSSIKNSSPPENFPPAGYATPVSQIHYVNYDQAGIQRVGQDIDPGDFAGATGICFMPARPPYGSINTHLPSNLFAGQFTAQGYFNSFATKPTSDSFVGLRIISQRSDEDNGNSRLALGLRGSSTGNEFAVYYRSNNPHQAHGEAQPVTGHVLTAAAPVDVVPGRWYHFALVWDGTEVRAYLDGVLSIQFTPTDMAAAGAAPMAVGSNRLYRAPTGDADRSWHGLLDMVVIHPDVLSDSEFLTAGVNLCRSCNTPFADADGNGFVDMLDFAELQRCYSLPSVGVPAECVCFDRDGDNDVDDIDVAEFTKCGSGPALLWTAEDHPDCTP